MSRRFFSEQPISSDRIRLEGPEAHHLIHVMRSKVNDSVVLFDGTGWEFTASVHEVGRKNVTLRIETGKEIDRELNPPIVLAVALPRGDRQEWLVQKAVELGVSRFVPWHTERSVARPRSQSLVRLRRTVIESSKQCRRNRLMQIDEPCDFAEFLPTASVHESVLAHVPNRATDVETASALRRLRPGATRQIGIGPEGGFTDEEVGMAEANGWKVIGLGPRILRTETAALALAATLAIAGDSE